MTTLRTVPKTAPKPFLAGRDGAFRQDMPQLRTTQSCGMRLRYPSLHGDKEGTARTRFGPGSCAGRGCWVRSRLW